MSVKAAEIFILGVVLGIVIGTLLGAKATTVRGLIGRFSPSRCCSFCGLPEAQVYKLLGGLFNTYICDRCTSLGREVLRSRSVRDTGNSRLEFLPPGMFARCSFCGKGTDDREMFGARGAHMCANCSEVAQTTLQGFSSAR
jgi:ClpX C4-type zinc finger protein